MIYVCVCVCIKQSIFNIEINCTTHINPLEIDDDNVKIVNKVSSVLHALRCK